MPIERIGDPPKEPCRHWDHNPPANRVFKPGTYRHTCPACGNVTVFTVPLVTCSQRMTRYNACPKDSDITPGSIKCRECKDFGGSDGYTNDIGDSQIQVVKCNSPDTGEKIRIGTFAG